VKANAREPVIGRSNGEGEPGWPSSRRTAPGIRTASASQMCTGPDEAPEPVAGRECVGSCESHRTASKKRTAAIPSAIA
jgi:hypothetical protein